VATFVSRRQDEVIFMLGLLEAYKTEYGFLPGTPIILGNCLGYFAGLVASGSADAEDALALVESFITCCARWSFAEVYTDQVLTSAGSVLLAEGARSTPVRPMAVSTCPDRSGRLAVRLTGTRAELLRSRTLLEGHVEFLEDEPRAVDLQIPFHTPLAAVGVSTLGRRLYGVPLRPARHPIASCTKRGALLADPNDLREELLRLLVGPVRWDWAVETAADAGVRSLIEVAKAKPSLAAGRLKPFPMSRVVEVRLVGREVASEYGRCCGQSRRALLDLLTEGALTCNRLLVDGISGAGKSLLLRDLGACLATRRIPYEIVHAGASIVPAQLHALRRRRLHPEVQITEQEVEALTDRRRLIDLLKLHEGVRQGKCEPQTVVLTDPDRRDPPGVRDWTVQLRRDTVLLVEGNIALDSQLAPWLGLRVFLSATRTSEVDLERIRARARSRAQKGPTEVARCASSTVDWRRAVVDLHRIRQIHNYDLFIDNTDPARPTVVPNPAWQGSSQ